MTSLWRTRIGVAFLLALCGNVQPVCAALPRRPESIQSFLERLPTIKVGKEGVRIRVEGRFERAATVRNRHAIKLLKCDVPFFSNRPLSALRDGTDVIQVTGQLLRNELGKPFVLVTDVETLPGDLNWVRHVRKQWKSPTVDDLIELATWARERARFYEDQELAHEADALFGEAIGRQRMELKPDDIAGRFTLAEQARQFGLPLALQWELIHEAFVLRARQLIAQSGDAKQLHELAEHIAARLPGAKESVSRDVWQGRAAYWEDPQAVYTRADLARRRQLHRLLYGQVVLAAVTAAHPQDGRDGFEAASELQRLLPEAFEEAESFRLAAMKYRFQHLDEADRKQMLELAQMYRVRNQPEKSREVIRTWLDKQEQRLRPMGGAGLVRLARDVWELTRDRLRTETLLRQAVPLLKNADPSSIEMQDLRDLFTELGYVRRNGTWVRRDASDAQPSETPQEQALIHRGMRAQDVRRLLGRPAQRTRVISRKQIVELWQYPTVGLTVRLVREPGQDAAVVAGLQSLRSR